jgi:hypothetical protein
MTAGPPVGSLEWGRRTGGRLSADERRALRLAMLRDSRVYARSRVLQALGRGPRATRIDLASLDLPDTALCRAVESAAAQRQSAPMLAHAYRTVAYATALSQADGVPVDRELLWCASLLHDVALEHPVQARCFAVRGGETAEQIALEAGADAETAAALGEAVCRHASPALDPRTDPLAYLVSNGALVDVVGKRLDEMEPASVAALVAAHPRDGFAPALAAAWRAEARAVPGGRAALAERTVLFSVAARIAPR